MRPHPLRPVATFVCAIAALSALHACVERPIEATVNVAPAATTTRCVKVAVWPKTDGTEASSQPLDPDSGTPFLVAVFRSDLEKSISLVARGYDDPACARINEVSPIIKATFGTDQNQVTLNLSGSPCTTSPAGTPCAGGTCRSDRMCVDAGSEFSCTNGLDDNSNGRSDCMDRDCTDVACSTTNLCVASPTCQVDGGCGGALKVCAAPPTACYNPTGACNALDGGCSYTINTSNSCNDGNACTLNDLCQVSGACNGTPKVCNTPPAQCYSPAGTCDPADGGCTYSVTVAAACDDLNACTTTDQCQINGSCVGATVPCNTPPGVCFNATGTCTSGTCSYAVNVANSCVDSNPCTGGETCQTDGGCAMTQLSGTPCSVLGDAGFCQTGACRAFPYRPSNFDVAVVADAGMPLPAALDAGCNAWFNTTTNTHWWCGLPAPVVVNVAQDSGVPAVVISVLSLDVPATSSLTIHGSRPAILAVWGNASIAGTISVASIIGADAGAGSDISTLCTVGNGAENTSGSNEGGGGGGGGGYGAVGGTGGDATRGGAGNTLQGGTAGAMNSVAWMVPLRGGCNGGEAGRGDDSAATQGHGGAGGGGVQLSAAGQLTISGTVTASGAGGQGGDSAGNDNDNGGGGGGSGGAVLLEGNQVLLQAAKLTANGGGGGGGVDNSGNGGTDGANGNQTAATAAGGGTGSGNNAGNGAAGGTRTNAAGNGANGDDNAGGGGGGGVGRIRVNFSSTCSGANGSTVSPTPTYSSGTCP